MFTLYRRIIAITFLIALVRDLTKNNVRKEGLVLTHSLREHLIMVVKAWQQKVDTLTTVRMQREINADAKPFFSFNSVCVCNHSCQMGLLSSGNTQRYVS